MADLDPAADPALDPEILASPKTLRIDLSGAEAPMEMECFALANRPPEIAYESPRAKPVYDAYHGTLARYCRDVQKAYGRGLYRG